MGAHEIAGHAGRITWIVLVGTMKTVQKRIDSARRLQMVAGVPHTMAAYRTGIGWMLQGRSRPGTPCFALPVRHNSPSSMSALMTVCEVSARVSIGCC